MGRGTARSAVEGPTDSASPSTMLRMVPLPIASRQGGLVSSEAAFVDALRGFAKDPAARGLLDDAAVLEVGGETLGLTHDMIVEGVHYLPGDPPADVAWNLVAVNLSD